MKACYNKQAYAGVAKLADALDLGSNAARRAGSIPVARTKHLKNGSIAVFTLIYIWFLI